MNKNHKELISIIVTLSIIGLALFIVHRFIPSLIWAGIIVVATYPLYERWSRWFGAWRNCSAFFFTMILSFLILFPLSWLITILIKELQFCINYLQQLNREGGTIPIVVHDFPFFAEEITSYWNQHFAEPGQLQDYISGAISSLSPATYYLKTIGLNIVHRSFQLGFTLLTLFFFYRDGNVLFKEINRVGEHCLGHRWYRYAHRLPAALRGTVNGTIVVGLGVGVLMGICYALVQFPAPTLTGFITALAAMIPFVVPVVFAFVAIVLFSMGSVWSALMVIIWGTIVMFVADHFVKPVLIGGSIQLPFLAVLFGILGGVETLGLLGLFIGPIIMVLFVTLWQESNASLQSIHGNEGK